MTEETFKAWMAHIELADIDELIKLSSVFAVGYCNKKIWERRQKKPPRKTKHWRIREAIASRMAVVHQKNFSDRGFKYWASKPEYIGKIPK